MKGEMKILIETEQRGVVSRSGQAVDEWCQACHSPVAVLSLAPAAMLAGVRTHAVDRWLEAGRFHGVETALTPHVFAGTHYGHLRKLGLSSKAVGDFRQDHMLKSGWEVIGLPTECQSGNTE